MHDDVLKEIVKEINNIIDADRFYVADSGHKRPEDLSFINFKIGRIEMGKTIIDIVKRIEKRIYEEEDDE